VTTADPTDAVSESDDDAALAALVGAGDRAALARLYDRHAPHVYTLARRVLRCDPDAEAIVSDVFLEFWRRPERFDPSRGALRTYLLVLARSRAIDRVRAETTRETHSAAAAGVVEAARPERQATADPQSRVIVSEHSRMVRDAVQRLDEVQRLPLMLAFFDGLTHRQIADRLDEPLGTIKTRIRSGMASLRSTLQAIGRHDDGMP